VLVFEELSDALMRARHEELVGKTMANVEHFKGDVDRRGRVVVSSPQTATRRRRIVCVEETSPTSFN
jgi:hypothetical protein